MPGVGFVFWNLFRKPLARRVADLTRETGADVVVLTEVASPADEFRTEMADLGDFRLASDPLAAAVVLCREPRVSGDAQSVASRWQFLRIRAGGRPDLTLAVAHLPSKRETDDDDRVNAAIGFATDIRAEERRVGHERTVLVGDLNMNPFEKGVMWCRGLHAVSSREVARRRQRTVGGEQYPFFYNPMWGVLGDRTPGPPGTYHRSAGKAVNYFWNVYDQVLLRPDVMDGLEDLRVIDSAGTASLLTGRGLPDAKAASDHLPLYFRLDW